MSQPPTKRHLMSLLGRLKQITPRNPILRNIFKIAYANLIARFIDREIYLRERYVRKIKGLSSFVVRNGMAGGSLTEEGEFYLRTPDGIYLYFNFSNDRYTIGDGLCLDFKSRQKTDSIAQFLGSYLKDGMVYFDVGANNGYYYSLRVAKRFPNCRIYVFEPDNRILYHLRKNIEYNRFNIMVVPQAVTDCVGTARLTAGQGASNYIIADGSDTTPTVEVKCTTLDNFVSQNNVNQIDLIKVDIEGGEFSFLRGAQKTIEKFQPVMVLELNEELLRRSKTSRRQILSFLKELRFRSFQMLGYPDVLALPTSKLSVLRGVGEKWLKEITAE